ncbi:MAG: PaaI family thioesterase [Anaerolineae bacterium]
MANERRLLNGSPVAAWMGVEYWLEPDGRISGSVTLRSTHEGPPNSAHGGLLVTLVDEAMGMAAWCAGHSVVTANLATNFRSRAPLETPFFISAWVASTEGRKIYTAAQITLADGSIVLDSTGLFIELPQLFADTTTTLRTPRSAP